MISKCKPLTLKCDSLEATILLDYGVTITNICFKGQEYIVCDEERVNSGATFGIPIMFPTPNLVDNSTALFQSCSFESYMHGCARKQKFQVIKRTKTIFYDSITCELSFNENQNFFKNFPFLSVLQVQIVLSCKKILWRYTVINKDTKPLGFGFGIHPFFLLDSLTTASFNAKYFMEKNSNLLPTGNLAEIEAKGLNFIEPTNMSNLNVNEIFYFIEPLKPIISYPSTNTKIFITASSEFKHLAVYATKGNFFCIEPQTCSPDCHNLYSKNFIKESGLQIVEPDKLKTGFVQFEFTTYI